MIRLPGTGTLSAPDRRALTRLTDLARLIPVADPAADVVSLELTDRPPRYASLRDWRGDRWGIAAGEGVVHIARAALRILAEAVDAAREHRTAARDRFGRVPSAENALVAEGLEREPIVSQAAAAFRAAVVAAAGRRPLRLSAPWPDGRRWAVAITHDLDVVAWWPAFTALRLGELVRKGAWARAARAGAAAIASVGRSPVHRGIAALLAAERARRVHSTWFVLCGTPTWRTFLAGDLTYRPEAAGTRRVLADLLQDGHALGLHGSFATVSAVGVLEEQRTRLAGLTGREVRGVRQHFLRFDLERTPRAMRSARFEYDSTAGFPDRNGFRLGVCDVLPSWDAEGQGEPLAEVPFAWMDRALSKYRDVEDPMAWVADALELASAARAVDGLWVGVWHPNLIPSLGFPDAPAAYARLLDGLSAEDPFVGTLDELVRWRIARARVRIARVAPDGRVELEGESTVPLESARPMKVLFLSHSYPRFSTDPVGSFVLRLGVALLGQGVETQVIAPAAPGLAQREEYEGVVVERFRYAPARFETLAYTGTMRDQVRGSWAAKAAMGSLVAAEFVKALRLRRAFRADLVHAHWWFPGGLVGTWLRRWWGVPLVITMHGSDVRLARGSRPVERLFRRVLAGAGAVTTVSNWLATETRAIAPAVRPIVAPMPIQPDLFHPGGRRAPETLLFVGKLNAQKGIDHLLRALAAMRSRPAVEIVVGAGSVPADVQGLAQSLGVADRLRWFPLLSQAELADRYRACTALVMPAVEEGLGLVAAEALLCETPVVAFASGGLTDLIVDGQTGRLVPTGDVAALARALDDLLTRPDRGAALGAAGRSAMLATFGPDAVATRYAAIYRQLLSGRAA